MPAEAFHPVDPVIDLLGGENVVALRPSFARAFGGVTVGVLLSQFWFYSRMDTAKARDGWFYASQEQLEEETGMTRPEQETARRKLRDAGILSEVKQGIPARLYFRLDKERMVVLLRLWIAEDEEQKKIKSADKESKKELRRIVSNEPASLYAGIQHTGAGKTLKQGRGKVSCRDADSPQTISYTSLRGTKKTLKDSEISASLFPEKKEPDKQEPEGTTPTKPSDVPAEMLTLFRQVRREMASPEFIRRAGRPSEFHDWWARTTELWGAGVGDAGVTI
jgi:hypothetical protein